MRKRERSDRRLTLFLPDRAILGRATGFTVSEMTAVMDGDVPVEGRIPFSLHLPGVVVSGEVTRVRQEGRDCVLMFTALTDSDRAVLAPFTPVDD